MAAKQNAQGDLLTLAAIAIVVYAIANILHEGVGHAGACLIVGGRPRVLSSTYFDCDTAGLAGWAGRIVAAGGTLVNLAAAAVGFGALRRARAASPQLRYYAWLFVTVNLLQGTGYFLFSGVANIGDWAFVVAGWRPPWVWRIALAALGAASYWFSVRIALVQLGPFIGGDAPGRYRRATRLALVPYLTGATLYCLAGLVNPMGMGLVAVSAAAASLGGTSGLAWGPQLLRGEGIPHAGDGPTVISRHWGWIVAGGVVALSFVGVLGPGVQL